MVWFVVYQTWLIPSIMVSRFMANPGQVHWENLKWVLRYLNDFLKSGLKYEKIAQRRDAIVGYMDANYAGNVNTGKFLFGYVFTMFGIGVCWKANL